MERLRRTQNNLGEKRVLLGSLGKKNSLKQTYDRLNLEEKAFISSSNFNQRRLLSRHSQLIQLQANRNGLNADLRFPDSRSGRYSSIGTSPLTPNCFNRRRTGNVVSCFFSNDNEENEKHASKTSKTGDYSRKPLAKRNSSGASESKRTAFASTVKRSIASMHKPESKEKGREEVRDSEMCLNKRNSSSEFQPEVVDILEYSGEIRKIEMKKGNVTDEIFPTDKKKEENRKEFRLSKTKSVDPVLSPDERRDLMDASAINADYETDSTPSHTRRGNVSKNASLDESYEDGIEILECGDSSSKAIETNAQNTLPSLQCNTPSNKMNFRPGTKMKNLLQCQVDSGSESMKYPRFSVFHDQVASGYPATSPHVPSLISRTPSWVGTDDMPALGRIRRGSICDVKTFTSGKVLGLLSSCKIPNAEKKTTKQFLSVEHDNLKYCRYLRSAVTREAAIDEVDDEKALEIPLKYRPSKQIIIGHTKVTPFDWQ